MYYYRSSVDEPLLTHGADSGVYYECEAHARARAMTRRETVGHYEAQPYCGLWEVVYVDPRGN